MTKSAMPNVARRWQMPLTASVTRVIGYSQRHGLRATFERVGIYLRRMVSSNCMVLFYYDLPGSGPSLTRSLPGRLRVERKNSAEEIDPQDWQRMIDFWNPEICQRNFAARFSAGASLWLARWDENLAGYGWSMVGNTIEPHYCPFGANDVHLFDFLVFPEYRGRQINPSLVEHILWRMATEGRTRAYIEVREWNQPQLNSLRRTGFLLLGVARKVSFAGRTFVEWTSRQQGTESKDVCVSTMIIDATKRASPISR